MSRIKNIARIKDSHDTKYRFYWKRRYYKKNKNEDANWQDIFDYYENKFVLPVKESYYLNHSTNTFTAVNLIYSALWDDRIAYLLVIEEWEKELIGT